MKRSIRLRFTVITVGMMALALLATWAANNWLLEKYYTSEKVRGLEEAYTRINQEVMAKLEEEGDIGDGFAYDGKSQQDEGAQGEIPLSQLLLEFSEKSNVAILLLDSNTGKAVFSSARDRGFLADKVQQYILGQGIRDSETIKSHEDYIIQKNYDARSKSYYLESWGFFSDNATMFIMSTPLTGIRESVGLSNRFLGIVAMTALIFSSILMYFATRRITSPILSLAHISERMSQLDFEARYTGKEQDEIGVLGGSMNVLSEKLKEAIGELQEANVQLKKDIDEKTKIDEMRKEFIANVSHELKTPIALIQGYAEGLQEGMADEKESRDYYCEVIMDEAGKMNRMVRQLLNLTALEFGNDEPALEEFDLMALIEGVVGSVGILAQQKDVEIQMDAWDGKPIWVCADEYKIEEVVTNYLSNALNHVEDIGGLGKRIEIRIGQDGKLVRVGVFNSGRQIPNEDIPLLWTKFYKVDKARTRAYGGSGIGLSIVKAIVDAHHQSCGVNNEEQGVEFWFTVELVQRMEKEADR